MENNNMETESKQEQAPRVTRSSVAVRNCRAFFLFLVQAAAKSIETVGIPKEVFGRKKSWADQMADDEVLEHSPVMSIEARSQRSRRAHSMSIPPSHMDLSSSTSPQVKFVNSTLEILQNQMKKEDGPKKKRTRTSPEQLKILQKAFTQDPMPNSAARLALAKKLGMNVRAVQVWFQNRRAKGKLDQKRSEVSIMNHAGKSDEESSAVASFRFKMKDQFMHEVNALPRAHSLPADFAGSTEGYISTDARLYSYPSSSSSIAYNGYANDEYSSEFQSFANFANEYVYPDHYDYSISPNSTLPVETDIDGSLKVPEDVSSAYPYFDRDRSDFYGGYGTFESPDSFYQPFDYGKASGPLRRCFSSPDVHYYLNSSQIEQLQQFDRSIVEPARLGIAPSLCAIQEDEFAEDSADEFGDVVNEEAREDSELSQYITTGEE